MQRAQERRVGPRALFGGQAHVRAGNFDMVCQSLNLSSDGILLLSPVRAQPGLSMRLNVYLPPLNKWGDTEAVLMRQQEHEGQLTWGVRFRDTPPFMGTVFRTFVRRALRGDYAAAAEKTSGTALDLLTEAISAPIRAPRRTEAIAPAADSPSAPPVKIESSVTNKRVTNKRVTNKQGATKASRDDGAPVALDLTPSESGLRTLYRNAIADLAAKSNGGKSTGAKRRFWSRFRKQ